LHVKQRRSKRRKKVLAHPVFAIKLLSKEILNNGRNLSLDEEVLHRVTDEPVKETLKKKGNRWFSCHLLNFRNPETVTY